MAEALLNIGIGILGIVVFIAWNSRTKILSNTFSIKTLVHENWKRWAWSVVMLGLIVLLVTIEPKLSSAIKAFTGLDIAAEKGAFFSTGLALAGLVKGVVKKTI